MEEQANTPPAAVELPIVPDTWPGEFGVYKHSKLAVSPNVWTLVAIYFLSGAVDWVARLILGDIGSLIGAAAGLFATGAYTIVFLAGIRGQKVSISEAVDQAWPIFGKVALLNLLVGFVLVLSLLAFIIPFFFVFPRLAFANYYLIDKKLGVMDAYHASWNNSKGHARKVLGIVGVNILILLLCITIIGIPFAVYFFVMYSAAIAVLYAFIQNNPAAPVKPTA